MKNLEEVKRLINNSIFLDEARKKDFLSLVPNLNQEGVDELAEFLKNAKQGLKDIDDSYNEEEQNILEKYSEKISADAGAAKKKLAALLENKSNQKDKGVEENLLKQLDLN